MLASGRPILATCAADTEMARTVEGCGRVVPRGDVGALAAALRSLANDLASRLRMGTAAREYALRHLGRDAVLGRLDGALAAMARP